MSRGPGRWQRTILEAVREGWIYLIHVLPPGAHRADYMAAYRVARELADRDRIAILRYAFGRNKIAVGQPGAPRPDRRAIRPVEPRGRLLRGEDGRLLRGRFGRTQWEWDSPPLPPHRIDWRTKQTGSVAKC